MIVAEGIKMKNKTKTTQSASMGPQLDSCGRVPEACRAIEGGPLQWGRNLIVAEGAYRWWGDLAYASFNGAAT